ncbi:MAG: hypothetical protein LBD91_07070 [Prevotellaceae bacterium]|nr:hypothetical protein [Prevotellaceae bacterium]
MLFFPALDVHYEYLINDENAIGASAQVSFNDYYFIPYQALGFYRFYFGKKPAAGFFIDLNASVYVFKKSSDLLESSDDVFLTRSRSESEFNGGLGVSIGVKYLTKRNVVVEMIYGFGRSIFNENFYPRFGITIGKRF